MERTREGLEGEHVSRVVIFDAPYLGQLLRQARYLATLGTPEEANARLRKENLGAGYSPRGMLAMERGDQEITLDQFFVLAKLYAPHFGMEYFMPAVKPEYREWMREFMGSVK